MIAEIGIIIGLYIITRCLSFLHRPEPAIVRMSGYITLTITIFITLALMVQGLLGSPAASLR
jgi:hypothetical protein